MFFVQFYSFGLLENDTVLRKSVDSDSSVVLLQNFYFYNQSIEVVYVSSIACASDIYCYLSGW